MRIMKIRTKGITYLILSLFTGALMPIVLAVAKNMNLFEFFMLTYMLAMPFALLITIGAKKQNEVIGTLMNLKKLSLMVLVGMLSYLPIGFFIMFSERYVAASLAAVVFRISPLLMLLFLPIVLKEKLSKNQVIALALGFVGIYIAMTAGNPLSVSLASDMPIIMLLAFGALLYALSAVLSKRYMFDMASGITIFNMSLFVLFTVLFIATGFRYTPLSIYDIIAIIYVAIANNVIGFYTYFIALRSLKTTFVTNVYFLSPFLTFLFAYALIGEAIKLYYIAIALLVIAGLLIQRVDKKGGTYAQKAKSSIPIFDITGAFAQSSNPYIYDTISKGGKVLAIKMHKSHFYAVSSSMNSKDTAQNYGVIVFSDEHDMLSAREKDYARDILGASLDELVVMSAGDADKSEELLLSMHNKALESLAKSSIDSINKH